MAYVPAHTSKVGYQKQTRSVQWRWGSTSSKFGSLPIVVNDTVTTAVSYRSETVKSNGVAPTSYSRKVGRIVSTSDVRIETSTNKLESGQSLGFRGLGLNEFPLGNSYSTPTVSVPQWMTDKVIQGAIQDLNDMQALIMEDFLQAKQTVQTAAGIFNRIVLLFLLARKGKWRQLRRTLRAFGYRVPRRIANGWLMYYYGIRPMISTIDAVLSSWRPRIGELRAKRKISTPVNQHEFVKGYALPKLDGSASLRAMCGLTVGVKQTADMAFYNALGNPGSSTDLDVLILAWALTPYSFVVDWILPVERWLSTRRWASGIKYKYGYVSKSMVADIRAIELNPMTGANDRGSFPKAHAQCMQFQRESYPFYVPPSGLSLNLSLTPTNLINASALLIQRKG